MSGEHKELVFECFRGATTVLTFDMTGAISIADDTIWFTAKNAQGDTDANAVIRHGLGGVAPYDTGVVVTSEPNGTFEVTIVPADTINLTVSALSFDVQVLDDSAAETIPVAKGVLRLIGEITKV